MICNNCDSILGKYLSDIPENWRNQIAQTICSMDIDLICADIVKCETRTSLSAFLKEGSEILITFVDENNISFTRKFIFQSAIDVILNDVDPKCLASISDWNKLTYKEKINLLISKRCECCPPTTTTTTTTTSTTTTSTTTTTTAAVCKTYDVTNTGGFPIVSSYTDCSDITIEYSLLPSTSLRICTLDTFTDIVNLDYTLVGSDCITTTTTTTAALSGDVESEVEENFVGTVISINGLPGYNSPILPPGSTDSGIHYQMTAGTVAFDINSPSIWDGVDIFVNGSLIHRIQFNSGTGVYSYVFTASATQDVAFGFTHVEPTTTTTTTSTTTTTTLAGFTVTVTNNSGRPDIIIDQFRVNGIPIGSVYTFNGITQSVAHVESPRTYGMRIIDLGDNVGKHMKLVHSRAGTNLTVKDIVLGSSPTTVAFDTSLSSLAGDDFKIYALPVNSAVVCLGDGCTQACECSLTLTVYFNGVIEDDNIVYTDVALTEPYDDITYPNISYNGICYDVDTALDLGTLSNSEACTTTTTTTTTSTTTTTTVPPTITGVIVKYTNDEEFTNVCDLTSHVVYLSGGITLITTGVVVYIDTLATTPLTAMDHIVQVSDGTIYNIDGFTGEVGSAVGSC